MLIDELISKPLCRPLKQGLEARSGRPWVYYEAINLDSTVIIALRLLCCACAAIAMLHLRRKGGQSGNPKQSEIVHNHAAARLRP
jgi:hypothetical protein